MNFFVFILFICFLVFLFCLYFLSRDDFVLLRKNVTMGKIFDLAILVCIASLLSARILYVLAHPDKSFLNPLVFFLFPYYPGLSILGGVMGGVFSLLLLLKINSMPQGRLLDFFAISLLSCLPIGFLGYFLFVESGKILSARPLSLIVMYSALFIIFIKFLLPLLSKSQIKEGTISLLFLISFSLISLIESFMGRGGNRIYFNVEDIILLVMLLASLAFLIKHEKLVSRVRKFRRERS